MAKLSKRADKKNLNFLIYINKILFHECYTLTMKTIKLILTPLLMLLFLGCQEKSDSGIAKIHWDRDMCTRCVMVVSDREHTVQLQDPKTHKQYVFDDIGCMAIWLKDTNPSYKDSVKIWVNDAKNGKWIDARKAYYTTGNITPMSFGFSAYKSKDELQAKTQFLDYDEIIKRILAKDTKKEPVMKCGAGKCGGN